MAAIDKAREITQKLEEARAKTIAESKSVFKEAVKELFDENPTLESFGWNQYTPYFNDGDTCEFGVNTYSPDINGISGDDITYDEEYSDNEELKNVQNNVEAFLEAFDATVYMEMYGDHTEITIHRDGTVEENECRHE